MNAPSTASAPKTRRRAIQYLIRSLPFLGVLSVGVVCFIALVRLREPPATRTVSKLAPLVETVPVASTVEQLRIVADGEVVPYRQTSVSAQVAGRIIHKSDACRAGNYVTSGQPLLEIDPRDFDLAIRQIQELVKQTQVSVEELDVELGNTEHLIKLADEDRALQESEVARYERLVRESAASRSALDAARRARIQSTNNWQSLQNQARLLKTRRGRLLSEKDRLLVDLEQALLNRQRCDITAPMDGVIVEDPVEQDDFVQPGARLFRIESTDRVEIRFELKLAQLRWIWAGEGTSAAHPPGRPYQLPALPTEIGLTLDDRKFVWRGVLARYDDVGLNPATRTVPCVAVVDEPRDGRWVDAPAGVKTLVAPPALLRGMFVTVELTVPSPQPLVEIPMVALRPGNRVWLLQDGQLSVREVTVAQTTGDRVWLFSRPDAIMAGDDLIVSPLALAVNHMPLRASANDDGFLSGGDTQPVSEQAPSERWSANGPAAESTP